MARSFSTENVKSLILQYQQMRGDLHGILQNAQKENKSAVEKAAATVIDSKVLSGSIADDLRRGQSKAPKTFDTQALMSALYKYIHSAPVVNLCLALSNEYGRQVQASLQALQQVASPFRRFFAGSKAKASAEKSYDYLSFLASGVWGNTIRQSIEAIRQISSVSSASAFADYETSPDTYYQALVECAPNTVRTDRPLSQMIPIVARHEALLDQYRAASSRLSRRLITDQNTIRQSAEKALAARVMEQLREFEVESLSQRRSGIRVKALRDAGYNTIEDIYCATVSNLASVRGISEDAAKVIKSEARKIAEDVQKTVRLKISSDNRTQDITALLTAIYAYIKNIDAKRSKSVRELSDKAKRILFMTGTALENRVDEMISLIDVLRPNLANRIRSIAFMSSAPQFREQVAPVYYRRKRDDVLTELPDVINNEEMCELLPEEEAMYENAVLAKHQTGIRRVSWMIEDLNKSSKARRMREIISDAEDDGRKVLVFSFYRDTLKAISSFLGSRCTQIINGSVPVERRQQIIDEFEDMPAGSVLLAQIGAGGTGLNIQAASVVIICEPQLKPSTENQAIARAHRMGQSRTVLVYRLLASDILPKLEYIKNERMHSTRENNPTVVSFPSIEVLVDYLTRNGIEFKDNRPKNGCLWIKAEALPNAKAVRIDGRRLMYSKASKALKGEAGWYIS